MRRANSAEKSPMSARSRDVICVLACVVLGAIVWGIHQTSLSHATQRPLKVVVIVFGLAAIGLWRGWQIRRTARPRPGGSQAS